jgi:hypothetical protein
MREVVWSVDGWFFLFIMLILAGAVVLEERLALVSAAWRCHLDAVA